MTQVRLNEDGSVTAVYDDRRQATLAHDALAHVQSEAAVIPQFSVILDSMDSASAEAAVRAFEDATTEIGKILGAFTDAGIGGPRYPT